MINKVKISPAEQRVLVLPDPRQEKTPGGIIIPENHEENKPAFGTLIVTGKGSEDFPMKYRTGQKILFSEYAGTDVKLNLDGKLRDYKVMDQRDIMAIVEEVE